MRLYELRGNCGGLLEHLEAYFNESIGETVNKLLSSLGAVGLYK